MSGEISGAIRVSFRLVTLSVFRWGGEFTWQTTGPEANASSEPFPLPTTFMGALLGPDPKKRLYPPLEEAPKALEDLMGCKVYVRAPYYPRQDGGAAIHAYPGNLVLLDSNGRLVWASKNTLLLSPAYVTTRGTALNRASKTTIQGMLFSESFIDPVHLKTRGIEAAISADLVSESHCSPSIPKSIVKFGSEMRPAIIEAGGEPLLYKLITSNPDPSYALIASPILIDSPEDVAKLAKGKTIRVNGCEISAPSIREIEDLLRASGNMDLDALEDGVRSLRIKVRILSPGVYSNGLPRRPYLAILPGSILKVSECDAQKLLHGLGLHSSIGFGTVVPLRAP